MSRSGIEIRIKGLLLRLALGEIGWNGLDESHHSRFGINECLLRRNLIIQEALTQHSELH